MRYCPQCKRLTAGDPLYCNHCGATYDAKLCPARHLNPRNAEVCAQCGSRDLSTPAPRMSLWLRPVLFLLALLPGVLLALLLLLVVVAMFQQLATNGQIQAQLVILLLRLAILWWFYIHLPKFIQKALRSLWSNKQKDKH
jgi:RNA polymerase subunit RPABC4/transcription elongation factor Spt4